MLRSSYDSDSYTIEFLRMTSGDNIVRINIQLEPVDDTTTICHVAYQYTALCETQNKFIETELTSQFDAAMKWWEKAINHYLVTGELLKKGV